MEVCRAKAEITITQMNKHIQSFTVFICYFCFSHIFESKKRCFPIQNRIGGMNGQSIHIYLHDYLNPKGSIDIFLRDDQVFYLRFKNVPLNWQYEHPLCPCPEETMACHLFVYPQLFDLWTETKDCKHTLCRFTNSQIFVHSIYPNPVSAGSDQ